jgi:hypothetical protein
MFVENVSIGNPCENALPLRTSRVVFTKHMATNNLRPASTFHTTSREFPMTDGCDLNVLLLMRLRLGTDAVSLWFRTLSQGFTLVGHGLPCYLTDHSTGTLLITSCINMMEIFVPY